MAARERCDSEIGNASERKPRRPRINEKREKKRIGNHRWGNKEKESQKMEATI
jgi:hypothetical protein